MDALIEHMVSNANDLQGAGATCMVGEGDKYRKELRDHIRQSIIQHEKELWDQTRRRPFGRMRVKRFSHLFPSEGDLVSGSEYLSRRVLPGFFTAIEMMIGPEMFEKRQLACNALVKDRKNKLGNSFCGAIFTKMKTLTSWLTTPSPLSFPIFRL